MSAASLERHFALLRGSLRRMQVEQDASRTRQQQLQESVSHLTEQFTTFHTGFREFQTDYYEFRRSSYQPAPEPAPEPAPAPSMSHYRRRMRQRTDDSDAERPGHADWFREYFFPFPIYFTYLWFRTLGTVYGSSLGRRKNSPIFFFFFCLILSDWPSWSVWCSFWLTACLFLVIVSGCLVCYLNCFPLTVWDGSFFLLSLVPIALHSLSVAVLFSYSTPPVERFLMRQQSGCFIIALGITHTTILVYLFPFLLSWKSKKNYKIKKNTKKSIKWKNLGEAELAKQALTTWFHLSVRSC